MARAMSDWKGLVAEEGDTGWLSAWNEIITELRVDRGMLLGNTQYSEMTGVERVKALDAIDDSIKTANEWSILLCS